MGYPLILSSTMKEEWRNSWDRKDLWVDQAIPVPSCPAGRQHDDGYRTRSKKRFSSSCLELWLYLLVAFFL